MSGCTLKACSGNPKVSSTITAYLTAKHYRWSMRCELGKCYVGFRELKKQDVLQRVASTGGQANEMSLERVLRSKIFGHSKLRTTYDLLIAIVVSVWMFLLNPFSPDSQGKVLYVNRYTYARVWMI